ncbi:ESX secretion-associated protein EspG [Actinophytocola oryzae]|uniref:ESAT-6 protein secretion system EspG family protein n=1 Tax=Actinophytocola oryzae TaxID=502181 RepID=A0A4R7VDE7_9PSEU|nr:ESX secretion-associated protein EspG [Actinophytocola oryzae]TDV47160.1 ESAT-6 protein secretion system EspG family protein [Actinophytocola oryzae]
MIISARSAVAVGVAEIDLLCAAADAAPPFPLRVPSGGVTSTERRAVLRAAGERLAARGLADERGPLGVAEAFAYLLQDARLTLDLVLSVGGDTLGAVLLVRQDLAVLVTQEQAAPESVCMAELPFDDAVDELLRLVPEHPAAMAAPFSLPRAALDRVYRYLLGRQGRPLDLTEWEELLAAHGIDDRLARRLVTHLQPVRGNGQMGLATRGGYANQWRRAGAELRWLDTERGRFQLVDTEDGGWLSVNPMHGHDLAAAVRGLALSVRG